MSRDIAQLHNHTKFSEKDSIAGTKDYAKKIKEYNTKSTGGKIVALAITEHANMFSMLPSYKYCTTPDEDGVTTKYIIGCEMYTCEDRNVKDDINVFHIVLLAKNETGLKNLYRIVTDGGFNKMKKSSKGKDYARTQDKTLEMYGEGIIALSACVAGIIPSLINAGKYDEAKAKALYYESIFDEFYLEIQPHEFPEQLMANEELVRMSKETGIPLVITSDSHYTDKEDNKYHGVLKAMAHHDPFTCDAHLRTPEEFEEYCIKYNIPLECMDNTVKIANQCNVTPIPKNNRELMPEFHCPKGYTSSSYLREKCYDMFYKQIQKKGFTDVKERIIRLNYELDIICSMGFADYFLILWDWFAWCRQNCILMGKGRGSAAASLVSYILNITTVDPIRNKFYFARFLNPERLSYPDGVAIHSRVA